MRSPAIPFASLLVVAGATFALALWHPFSPSAPTAAAAPQGDAERGASVYAATCAGCHAADASGRGWPSRCATAGSWADDVEAVVTTGRGTMPAGVVWGQEVGT